MAVQYLDDARADGTVLGQSASSKLGFFGLATPIVQPAAAQQLLLTDSSGGVVSGTIATITGTYNQTIIANAFASVISQTNAIRTSLVALGLIKGGA